MGFNSGFKGLKYLKLEIVNQCSRTPLIRTLVIRFPSYPDRLGPSGKFVENSTILTCLEITGYRIKYSTALWLPELPGVVVRFRRRYIMQIVTGKFQTAIVAYFQRKI